MKLHHAKNKSDGPSNYIRHQNFSIYAKDQRPSNVARIEISGSSQAHHAAPVYQDQIEKGLNLLMQSNTPDTTRRARDGAFLCARLLAVLAAFLALLGEGVVCFEGGVVCFKDGAQCC